MFARFFEPFGWKDLHNFPDSCYTMCKFCGKGRGQWI